MQGQTHCPPHRHFSSSSSRNALTLKGTGMATRAHEWTVRLFQTFVSVVLFPEARKSIFLSSHHPHTQTPPLFRVGQRFAFAQARLLDQHDWKSVLKSDLQLFSWSGNIKRHPTHREQHAQGKELRPVDVSAYERLRSVVNVHQLCFNVFPECCKTNRLL
jgi:hypothetical protein